MAKNIQSLRDSRRVLRKELEENIDWHQIATENIKGYTNHAWWKRAAKQYAEKINDLREALRILNQYK